MDKQQVREILRGRLVKYGELRNEHGEEGALEIMLEPQVERERRQMAPFIEGGSLAAGFERAIPLFEAMGMKMRAVDLSSDTRDGVLEIHGVCPYAEFTAEAGIDRPCAATCELDLRAVCVAFPNISGRVLSTIADGDCACIFKYERALED